MASFWIWPLEYKPYPSLKAQLGYDPPEVLYGVMCREQGEYGGLRGPYRLLETCLEVDPSLKSSWDGLGLFICTRYRPGREWEPVYRWDHPGRKWVRVLREEGEGE